MSAKGYTLLETPSGIGEMLRAGRHLAKVFYYLEVRQAIPGGQPAADAAGQTAAWVITGAVTVSQDEPMQAQVNNSLRSGEVFTLVLADGRRLEVRASQGDPLEKQFHVTSASAAGFSAR